MGHLWLILSFSFVLITGALYILIRRSIPYLVSKRVAGYQDALLFKHYEEIQNIYQTMRGWRHDYHNHIQTMKAHLALNQLEQLDNYLDSLEQDLQTIDTIMKTGNIRLDAILNSKISLIMNRNIEVNAKAQVPGELKINEIDLCVIIGNLLDNSLESCEKLPADSDRFIRVYIGVLKQHLYISVTNSTANSSRIEHGKYFSSKGIGHGFGLARIDALVNKHGGYINRQNEPGVFATEIMLPL
jgi:sensor histidine kinase regulating citrate/malate metabolism